MPPGFKEFSSRVRWELMVSIVLALLSLIAALFFKSAYISAALFALLFAVLGWSYFELTRVIRIFYEEREERGAILANLSDALLQYDPEGKILVMNSKAEELFGVKPHDVAGIRITKGLWDQKPELRALVEVVHPELAPYALWRGGESVSSEKGYEIHTSRPELRLFVVSREIRNSRGRAVGYLKIIRDISHEALLSKIKSEFVSVAAHQLRTPLAALKWSLRLMLDGDMGPVEEKQKEFLGRTYETTERMVKLVNDLLDAARIEEGRFGYEFKEVDYIGFVEKIVKNYETLAKSRRMHLIFFETKDIIPPIYADPDRLSMALSNLIENGLRYTPADGKIEIKISLEGERVKTTVSDTGAGIPEVEQPRVFSKFFRASNAIKLETEGTGLGLFIARNIVRRHGGDISFVSETGKGTTFILTLPLKRDRIPSKENPVIEEFLGSI